MARSSFDLLLFKLERSNFNGLLFFLSHSIEFLYKSFLPSQGGPAFLHVLFFSSMVVLQLWEILQNDSRLPGISSYFSHPGFNSQFQLS